MPKLEDPAAGLSCAALESANERCFHPVARPQTGSRGAASTPFAGLMLAAGFAVAGQCRDLVRTLIRPVNLRWNASGSAPYT